jgi:hypothetical protein
VSLTGPAAYAVAAAIGVSLVLLVRFPVRCGLREWPSKSRGAEAKPSQPAAGGLCREIALTKAVPAP